MVPSVAVALVLSAVSCATATPSRASNRRDVCARAEHLCRHSIFEVSSLEEARHDPSLASLVSPEQLARIRPCDGDLGLVEKCLQEHLGLSLLQAVAPHVRCECLEIEEQGHDVLRVEVRQVRPEIPFTLVLDVMRNAAFDFTRLPSTTSRHLLVFRRGDAGWAADLTDAGLAPEGPR
jgi:hypothetical protein